MNTMTLFYLEGCPYCRNARLALEALKKANPDYAAVEVEMVEESRQPEVAVGYDYYHVPAIFADGEKLYEASPWEDYAAIEAKVRAALDAVLAKG